MKIRNVAIIAHVDHGKTTLVDAMLKQTGMVKHNQHSNDRILDSNALERERGITILAKNISVPYKDYKINIVDTPGHADFGGEVERVLGMVDGAILVVDAAEGPMPQTRFVLQKALEHKLTLIVVINKVDRPLAQPHKAVEEVFDLLIALGADDEQLDFPVYYASALSGVATMNLDSFGSEGTIFPILEGVISYVPAPEVGVGRSLQVLVSNLDYDDYVGRIAVGRVHQGEIRQGQEILITHDGETEVKKGKIALLYTFEGLNRKPIEMAGAGDIVAFSGVDEIQIGDTVNQLDNPLPLPSLKIDEPTMTMIFRVNDSPFAGQDGTYLTSRHLRDRLLREEKTNVALKVSATDSPEAFLVAGRGELHLSVLIETMRREGYEFCVSKPEPILRQGDSGVEEPYELLVVDVPKDYFGAVMELIGVRKGELQTMDQVGDRLKAQFVIPARGLIGFASLFLTETKGYGVMHHVFSHYGAWAGQIPTRQTGSIIAWETGIATSYALQNAEQRGTLFIEPGTHVYAGMVVGENNRSEDLDFNVVKKKHVTNMRAAGSEDTVKLVPPRVFSLEQAIAFLANDEYLEVTPKSLRMRKAILDRNLRERSKKQTSK